MGNNVATGGRGDSSLAPGDKAMGEPEIAPMGAAIPPSPRPPADPRCARCGGKCRWAEDAWVCRHCGDEFGRLKCPAHLVLEPCPTCSAYIAAGL